MTTTIQAPKTLPSVGMGQALVAHGPDSLTCVLGSCVGLTLHHPRLRVGVLAHIVLPQSAGRAGHPAKFADTVLPHLLELLQREGVSASGLVVRLAGGANMFGAPSGPMQVGEQNIQAVRAVVEQARLRVVGEHLGGSKGRRIVFNCDTGALSVEIAGQPPVVI